MSKRVNRLEKVTSEQRVLIKKLIDENQRLKRQTQFLVGRIRDMEQTNLVIDRAVVDIPIGIDLIPEADLNRY